MRQLSIPLRRWAARPRIRRSPWWENPIAMAATPRKVLTAVGWCNTATAGSACNSRMAHGICCACPAPSPATACNAVIWCSSPRKAKSHRTWHCILEAIASCTHPPAAKMCMSPDSTIPTGNVISRKHDASRLTDMPHGRAAIYALFVAFTVWLTLPHASANEVIPLIRPLLGPDDTLSGMDFRLIIHTSDKNLKEVERILEQMDVARHRLRIAVEQAADDASTTTSQSMTGEVRVGDKARVTLPAKTPEDGGLVVQKDKLRYSASRRTTTASNANTQTVMTLDGQRAYIRVGRSVPHVKKILALSRHQLVLIQDVEIQDVTTGFDVLPRVLGDRVLVEITPRLSSLRDPATGLVDFDADHPWSAPCGRASRVQIRSGRICQDFQEMTKKYLLIPLPPPERGGGGGGGGGGRPRETPHRFCLITLTPPSPSRERGFLR